MYVCESVSESVSESVCLCVRFGGKRSVLIGREPTNQDAEFLAAVKRSLSIGREAVRRSAPIGRGNGAF